MSKNQRGLWPARSSDFRIPSCFQTQNGCFCCCLPTPATFMVGLTGLEPVTLRLSSACSNQLSYRPGSRFAPASGVAALWWRHGDSNPRPIACKATALPTELCPHAGSKVYPAGVSALKQKLNCALPFQIFEPLFLSLQRA